MSLIKKLPFQTHASCILGGQTGSSDVSRHLSERRASVSATITATRDPNTIANDNGSASAVASRPVTQRAPRHRDLLSSVRAHLARGGGSSTVRSAPPIELHSTRKTRIVDNAVTDPSAPTKPDLLSRLTDSLNEAHAFVAHGTPNGADSVADTDGVKSTSKVEPESHVRSTSLQYRERPTPADKLGPTTIDDRTASQSRSSSFKPQLSETVLETKATKPTDMRARLLHRLSQEKRSAGLNNLQSATQSEASSFFGAASTLFHNA